MAHNDVKLYFYVFLIKSRLFLNSKASCYIPVDHVVNTAFFGLHIKLHILEIRFVLSQIIFPHILCDLHKILCGIRFSGKLYGYDFLCLCLCSCGLCRRFLCCRLSSGSGLFSCGFSAAGFAAVFLTGAFLTASFFTGSFLTVSFFTVSFSRFLFDRRLLCGCLLFCGLFYSCLYCRCLFRLFGVDFQCISFRSNFSTGSAVSFAAVFFISAIIFSSFRPRYFVQAQHTKQ